MNHLNQFKSIIFKYQSNKLLFLFSNFRNTINKRKEKKLFKMSDAATEFKPNLEKLKKLESQHASIMIGGKVRNNVFTRKVFKKNSISQRVFQDERRRLFIKLQLLMKKNYKAH
jgi:hypothetical protein